MRSVNGVPDELIWIVEQHHECVTGDGFPNQIKKSEVFPLSLIVAIANKFVDDILPSSKNTHPLYPEEAVKNIEILRGNHLSSDLIKALHSIVGTKFDIRKQLVL